MKNPLWSGSTRGGHTPLYLPIHAKFTIRILFLVIVALLLGILITVWNIYQLRSLQESHMSGFHSSVEVVGAADDESKPVLWLHAKKVVSEGRDHQSDSENPPMCKTGHARLLTPVWFLEC